MRTAVLTRSIALAAAGALLVSCSAPSSDPASPAPTEPSTTAGHLRDAAPEGFVIGTAVAGGGRQQAGPFTDNDEYREILATQFSSVTHENQLKWESVRPDRDTFDFEEADAVVEFAEQNGQQVRGHTLFWHSQNPSWLEQGDFSPDELREILREHIETVVGRYAGRIAQWDVANEIFDDDAQLRTEENIWIRELGPEIIADAFRWAHEADPDALLFLNDYSVESIGPKSDAYVELASDLLADDVPLHGFGIQGHLSMQYGFPGDLRDNLQRFADLGLATAITEIDVRMELPASGEPSDDQLDQQAEYYQRALEACLEVDGCDSFTVWGFADAYSWVPYFFPEEGAAAIFADDLSPKPAFAALLATLTG